RGGAVSGGDGGERGGGAAAGEEDLQAVQGGVSAWGGGGGDVRAGGGAGDAVSGGGGAGVAGHRGIGGGWAVRGVWGQRASATDGHRRDGWRSDPQVRCGQRNAESSGSRASTRDPRRYHARRGHVGRGRPGVAAMPVFEYEVADPTGAVSRGRAEAENAGALVLRFREQDRWVLNLRPAGRSTFADDAGLQAIVGGFQRALMRLFRGVKLSTLLLFTGQL